MLKNFLKSQSKSGAGQALENHNKTVAVMEQRVADLEPLILRRLAAEKSLANERAAAALGEKANVEGAQQELDAALAEIETSAALLGALRQRLTASVPDLTTAYERASAALPGHAENVRTSFAEEWAAGVAAYSHLLGRRAALEALVGRMELPSPSPGSIELAAEARPYEELSELRAAIKACASAAGHGGESVEVFAAGAPVPPYDPRAVYRLRHRVAGLPEGTLVVESSLAPGRLKALVQGGWASPAVDLEQKRLAREAKKAVSQLEDEARLAEAQQRAAEEKRMKAENFAEAEKRDPRLRWREEARQPDPPKVTITPATMFPDNPERQNEGGTVATMNPVTPAADPERQALERDLETA